jgi:hypothetical protein
MISFPNNLRDFEAVCACLSNHQKAPHHTPIYTLNWLFRKNMSGLSMPDQLPVLSASNAVVTKISRPKIEWAKLANTSKQNSHPGDSPIVVLIYGEMERLIDGNHRCRYWGQHRDEGMHEAFVLIVTDRRP